MLPKAASGQTRSFDHVGSMSGLPETRQGRGRPSSSGWSGSLQNNLCLKALRAIEVQEPSRSAPQRDHRGAFAGADQGRDVVAHLGEGIAAARPSVVLVVAGD